MASPLLIERLSSLHMTGYLVELELGLPLPFKGRIHRLGRSVGEP
jgi:hypothetical protein